MIRYIGLDFESSGTDPWGNHVPIQLGIAAELVDGHGMEYVELIGKWDWSQYEWSAEAADVHKIDRDLLNSAYPAWQVDIVAAAILLDEGLGSSRMWNVIVGWNVAGFDRQFITRWFPNLNRILSYRTVDLNAIVFSMAEGEEKEYNKIKKAAKNYAQEKLGGDAWHNALFDAKAALLSFEYLTEAV
jgi:hypothetical protein